MVYLTNSKNKFINTFIIRRLQSVFICQIEMIINVAKILQHWFFLLPFAGEWNYEDPSSWPSKYPECGGMQQSPRALTKRESFPHILLILGFYNYGKPLSAPIEILNNGYIADVPLRENSDGTKPYLRIGGLFERFEIQGLHFHWGSEGIPGSEHTIEGTKYDLEMHLVHKNSRYPTFDEALKNPDGFVVLGVLFRAVSSQPSSSHSSLKAIYDALGGITAYNTSAEIRGPITMRSFLPDLDLSEFFRYQGSLTTPPCSEAVSWFVFSDILPISEVDLRKFWNLLSDRGTPIINNFRPLQQNINPVFRKPNILDLVSKRIGI